jgi:hypothetical protein
VPEKAGVRHFNAAKEVANWEPSRQGFGRDDYESLVRNGNTAGKPLGEKLKRE